MTQRPLTHRRPAALPYFLYGSAYYPEHWDKDIRAADLTALFERYWEWQVTTNTRETNLFFETFGGNHLHFYPRGVALWGVFDAVNGVAIDRTQKLPRIRHRFSSPPRDAALSAVP